jgi:hypothetical protein
MRGPVHIAPEHAGGVGAGDPLGRAAQGGRVVGHDAGGAVEAAREPGQAYGLRAQAFGQLLEDGKEGLAALEAFAPAGHRIDQAQPFGPVGDVEMILIGYGGVHCRTTFIP